MRQKRIRDQIGRIGLYWSEVAGKGVPYTVANLEKNKEKGAIKVEG